MPGIEGTSRTALAAYGQPSAINRLLVLDAEPTTLEPEEQPF